MRGITRIELVLIAVLLVIVMLLMLPALQRSRDTGYVPTCRHQLHMIGLGLHMYHDVYDCFPPAFIADGEETPQHSWRTLMLPQIDERYLHDEYDFSQPWNSDVNIWENQVLNAACPRDVNLPIGRTSYLAVIGPHTAWRGDRAVSLNEITDPTDQTILLVEVANSDVDWFQPRDLNWDEMSFSCNDPDGSSPGSYHVWDAGWFGAKIPYINVLMVDGSVKRLPADTPPDTLQALLTIDGGETIADPFLR